MGPIGSRPDAKDLEKDARPESICRGVCKWSGWLVSALQWQILCSSFRTRPARIRRPNQAVSVFHLDWFACFLKLANHNGVASDVDQTDVGFFKMCSNFFSIGGVSLEHISESRKTLQVSSNLVVYIWSNLAFNIVLILRNYEDDHDDHVDHDDDHGNHDDDDHDNSDDNDIFIASYRKNQKLQLFKVQTIFKCNINVTLLINSIGGHVGQHLGMVRLVGYVSKRSIDLMIYTMIPDGTR